MAPPETTQRIQIHRLKITTRWFRWQENGAKRFELRRNDRDFRPGDLLLLEEHEHAADTYTGRHLIRRVTYVLDASDVEGLALGFVILGTEPADDECPF